MKRFWIASWMVCLLSELFVPAAMAGVSACREGDRVVIRGDHFRLTINGRRGGQIDDLRQFDGSAWNRLLGADGQTCPAVTIRGPSAEFRLDEAAPARIETLEASPELVRVTTEATPRSADGRLSPWIVKLQYEVFAEGAVFVTVECLLPEGETVLTGAEMSLKLDRAVVQAAKYRQQIDNVQSYTPTGLPSARVAFGVNPTRGFTNEVQALVEYKAAMAGKAEFVAGKGQFTWTLADAKTAIRGPFQYRNRFSLGLGAAATGKPKTNLIAQRVYHWINWENYKEVPGRAWYPTDELIDKMAANRATMLVMHEHWMAEGGSNGNPHANYRPRDPQAFARTIHHAHEKGLRVGVYSRGIERYAPSVGFFEKYLRRDWDGLYVDWDGAHCIANHESQCKPDAALGDTHYSNDGAYLPAREYFLYTKKLRNLVGPKGFLIGHMGFGSTGILANLAMDAYLPGENPDDHNMFSGVVDNATYNGMLGGIACMPWTLDSPGYVSPQGVAKMAVWGFYPHTGLAFQRPGKKNLFPADPDDPANAYILPYWRVLAAVDAERSAAYNSPAVNLVAASSSHPSVSCLVYKQAGNASSDDAYLVVAANLSDKPASATITLKPEVLGLSGSYQLSRVNSQTGAVSPGGVATDVLKTTELAPWQIEGLKLTKPCGAWKQPTLPLPTNNDPANQIRFHTPAEADAKRQQLINWIWPSGLPTSALPSVAVNIAFPEDLSGITQSLAVSVDGLDASVMGMHSISYLIHPTNTASADRLVIVHMGHTNTPAESLGLGIGATVNRLLQKGYCVIIMQMPLNGWNATSATATPPGGPPVTISGTGTAAHNNIFTKLTPPVLPNGGVFRFYIEPVVQNVNYFKHSTPKLKDVSMIGLSGGAWTTTMASAIDTRIKLSVPVAGSGPFYVYNRNHWVVGDGEQSYFPLFAEDIAADGSGGGVATYLEVYALGGYGAGRRQLMITNQYDSGCFAGVFADSLKDIVANVVRNNLHAGQWDYLLDSTHKMHQISPWALDTAIVPALEAMSAQGGKAHNTVKSAAAMPRVESGRAER
jgi:hypothetical protein